MNTTPKSVSTSADKTGDFSHVNVTSVQDDLCHMGILLKSSKFIVVIFVGMFILLASLIWIWFDRRKLLRAMRQRIAKNELPPSTASSQSSTAGVKKDPKAENHEMDYQSKSSSSSSSSKEQIIPILPGCPPPFGIPHIPPEGIQEFALPLASKIIVMYRRNNASLTSTSTSGRRKNEATLLVPRTVNVQILERETNSTYEEEEAATTTDAQLSQQQSLEKYLLELPFISSACRVMIFTPPSNSFEKSVDAFTSSEDVDASYSGQSTDVKVEQSEEESSLDFDGDTTDSSPQHSKEDLCDSHGAITSHQRDKSG